MPGGCKTGWMGGRDSTSHPLLGGIYTSLCRNLPSKFPPSSLSYPANKVPLAQALASCLLCWVARCSSPRSGSHGYHWQWLLLGSPTLSSNLIKTGKSMYFSEPSPAFFWIVLIPFPLSLRRARGWSKSRLQKALGI